jgi:hypothetical protein
MMRLMRSLVSTQALPVVEFELSTLGLAQIRPHDAYGSPTSRRSGRGCSDSSDTHRLVRAPAEMIGSAETPPWSAG